MQQLFKTFLISGALVIFPLVATAQDQEGTPVAAESVTQEPMAPPSSEVLNDLESQLDNLERAIEQAEAATDESGLPVIDPENEPDVFYDSMPVRRGVQPTAPEKVDPIARPAGKIIHVTKDFDSEDDQAILVSAKRALDLGRYDSALSFYEQLYAKNPRDSRVLMGKAIALQKLGRVQNAIKAYEELLSVQPGNVKAEVSMLGLVKERFPAIALKRMLELYDKNPNDAGLNAQIGMAYAEIGNLKDAIRYLGMAISLQPNNPSYYYNLAVISDKAGDFKQAVLYYEEALSKDRLYGAERSLPRDVIYDRLSVIRKRL